MGSPCLPCSAFLYFCICFKVFLEALVFSYFWTVPFWLGVMTAPSVISIGVCQVRAVESGQCLSVGESPGLHPSWTWCTFSLVSLLLVESQLTSLLRLISTWPLLTMVPTAHPCQQTPHTTAQPQNSPSHEALLSLAVLPWPWGAFPAPASSERSTLLLLCLCLGLGGCALTAQSLPGHRSRCCHWRTDLPFRQNHLVTQAHTELELHNSCKKTFLNTLE